MTKVGGHRWKSGCVVLLVDEKIFQRAWIRQADSADDDDGINTGSLLDDRPRMKMSRRLEKAMVGWLFW